MGSLSHFVHQVGAVFYDTTRALVERRVAHAVPLIGVGNEDKEKKIREL